MGVPQSVPLDNGAYTDHPKSHNLITFYINHHVPNEKLYFQAWCPCEWCHAHASTQSRNTLAWQCISPFIQRIFLLFEALCKHCPSCTVRSPSIRNHPPESKCKAGKCLGGPGMTGSLSTGLTAKRCFRPQRILAFFLLRTRIWFLCVVKGILCRTCLNPRVLLARSRWDLLCLWIFQSIPRINPYDVLQMKQ